MGNLCSQLQVRDPETYQVEQEVFAVSPTTSYFIAANQFF